MRFPIEFGIVPVNWLLYASLQDDTKSTRAEQ